MEWWVVIIGIPPAVYYSFLCWEKIKEYGINQAPQAPAKLLSTYNPLKRYLFWIFLARLFPDKRQGFFAFSLAGLIVAQYSAIIFIMCYYYILSDFQYRWLDWIQSIGSFVIFCASSYLCGVFLFGICYVAIGDFLVHENQMHQVGDDKQ